MIQLTETQKKEFFRHIGYKPYWHIEFYFPDLYDENNNQIEKPQINENNILNIGTLTMQSSRIYNELKYNNLRLSLRFKNKTDLDYFIYYLLNSPVDNPPKCKLYLGYRTDTNKVEVNFIYDGIIKKEFSKTESYKQKNEISLNIYGGFYGVNLHELKKDDTDFLKQFSTLSINTIMNYFNYMYNIKTSGEIYNIIQRLLDYNEMTFDLIILNRKVKHLDIDYNYEPLLAFANDMIIFAGEDNKLYISNILQNMIPHKIDIEDNNAEVEYLEWVRLNRLGDNNYNTLFLKRSIFRNPDPPYNLITKFFGGTIDRNESLQKFEINISLNDAKTVEQIVSDGEYFVVAGQYYLSTSHWVYYKFIDLPYNSNFNLIDMGDSFTPFWIFTIGKNDFFILWTYYGGTSSGASYLKIRRFSHDTTIAEFQINDNNLSGSKLIRTVSIIKINNKCIFKLRIINIGNITDIFEFIYDLDLNTVTDLTRLNITNFSYLIPTQCIIDSSSDLAYYISSYPNIKNHKLEDGSNIELETTSILDNNYYSGEIHTYNNELLLSDNLEHSNISKILLYGKPYIGIIRTDLIDNYYKNINALYKEFAAIVNAYYLFLQEKLLFEAKELTFEKEYFTEDEIFYFEEIKNDFVIKETLQTKTDNIINIIKIKYNNNKLLYEKSNNESTSKWGTRYKILNFPIIYNIADVEYLAKNILNLYSEANEIITLELRYFPIVELLDLFDYKDKIWQVITVKHNLKKYLTTISMSYIGIKHSIWGESEWGVDTWG